MIFSSSDLVKALPDNYFSAMDDKVNLYKSKGIDVINLAAGNPDQPTPAHIISALKEAVDQPINQGYPPFHGKKSTLEAVAAFYKREYQVELNPGDWLLTTDPAYPQYYSAAALARAHIHTIPLDEKHGFLPDYTTVPEEIAEQVKLLMINYPNNPTGAVATADFLTKTLDYAARYQFPVMNDFAYGALGFDGRKPISLLQIPGGKEYGVETYTASKTYNMAGWRFGFAVGNSSIIGALKHYHTHAYSTVFGAVQDAGAVALLGTQEPVRELAALYERRRDVLIAALRGIGWDVAAPQGSFFAWFKVPEGYTSASFADFLLDEAHVAVAPGEGFGRAGASHVRVSLVNSEERLLEAVQRIAATGIFQV
ncbi:aminotransferase class I/II-fold pyridoxal phosphate-dependent enzyme [Paenibacillus polymyxa]|uniref:aminotransferase class I/II-fold pyridoxal phosphate-dependent enzyme n=1 Tax=Paenibacillus polymyxa TaxID=1406 RepID=UPI0020259050|nr:aminotransferase class I/II-fold pyridoxal phosphate-dependent enzyme [Paenibacillus polymyxa]WDZ63514.1 aminotransferase class I/II-fold pyridoxal phosphate-dependent enzyme [Paenibacillus polymyxa]